jgi:hypothetical protein
MDFSLTRALLIDLRFTTDLTQGRLYAVPDLIGKPKCDDASNLTAVFRTRKSGSLVPGRVVVHESAPMGRRPL